jgi:SprT protein
VNLTDVQQLAESLMAEHLTEPAHQRVVFAFDNGKRRAGCVHSIRIAGEVIPQRLTLSRHLMVLWDEAEVRDTILHEIAHVIAGHGAGHGYQWMRVARSIGAKPERCYSGDQPQVEGAFVAECKNGHVAYRHRRPKAGRQQSCGRCSNRFDSTNVLTWMTRAEWRAVQAARTAVEAAQAMPVAASTPTPDPTPAPATRAVPASRQDSLF